MRLSALPLPVILEYVIFIPKLSETVFEASAPISIIDAGEDYLISAISFPLIFIVDLSVVHASTFHDNFNHIAPFGVTF